jgi:hypothetical protein
LKHYTRRFGSLAIVNSNLKPKRRHWIRLCRQGRQGGALQITNLSSTLATRAIHALDRRRDPESPAAAVTLQGRDEG